MIHLTYTQLTAAAAQGYADVERDRPAGMPLDLARHVAVIRRQAEAALAVHLGKPVPDRVVVRAVTRQTQGLLHKQEDDPGRIYVAVLVWPPFFELRGWLPGQACRNQQWWRTPAGRPGCWLVPVDQLARLDTLDVANL